MGLKFEYGPDGQPLMSLYADDIHDGECDFTPHVSLAVLYTRATLDSHKNRLAAEHFEAIADGGLILRMDDEYGTVDVYPTRAELDHAWQALLRSSHVWKKQRIRTLRQQARQARRLLTEAVTAWPQFDSDQDVSGADLAEWFTLWRTRAKACLAHDDAGDRASRHAG